MSHNPGLIPEKKDYWTAEGQSLINTYSFLMLKCYRIFNAQIYRQPKSI